MAKAQKVDSGSGVPISTGAAETAAELAQSVREATGELQFGLEPASFLVALVELAETDETRT